MKTALRILALALSAVVGLWVLIHGIVLLVSVHRLAETGQDKFGELVEISVSIAGGICVLSVAVEQINCWRTHRKEDSLL